MKYAIFPLFLIISFGFFGSVGAQQLDFSQTTINIELIPQNPGPNEVVYVSLTSYATNLDAATITWKVNGKTLKNGMGEKNFIFTTGGMNVKTLLDITIKTAENETIEKKLTINPSEVDMIWQSESYVPPFYKGKALFSHQNQITVIAVPHISNGGGGELNTKSLIYKWKSNGSVIDTASGFGKNFYTFTGSLISRPLTIEVEVSSPNGIGQGYGSISLTPGEPEVILYKKDPTYGIQFQKALQSNVELKNSKEITVVGFALFFGVLNHSSSELSYKWAINGIPTGTDSSLGTQVFRRKEGTSGASNVSLSIEHANKILQSAAVDFNLKFEDKKNSE